MTGRHSTGPEPPPDAAAWPSRTVRMASRALPAGEVRDRYRDEFLAELYGMTRPEQTRHAVAVLVHTAALRSAVCHRSLPVQDDLGQPAALVLCRLGLRHVWVVDPPDGPRECARCGKQDPGRSGPA